MFDNLFHFDSSTPAYSESMNRTCSIHLENGFWMLFDDIHESFQPELSDYKVYVLDSWEHDKKYKTI